MSNYQVNSSANTGTVDSVVAGANIAVNNTDPVNPVVSVSGTTQNAIQIGNASGSLTSLGITNNSTLVTNGSGVPSLSATLPTAVQTNITQLGEIAALTASQAVVTDASKNLVSLAYTNANTASTLVQRDSSGNFSSGKITSDLDATKIFLSGSQGLAGQVITSVGPSNPCVWSSIPVSGLVLNKQIFTLSGTYIPTAGLSYAYVEVIGAGGGGGGVASQGIPNNSASGGGGYGEYASGFISAATIGVSQVITVGAAGSGGAAGNNPGGNGLTSSFGSLITAFGATGGSGAGVGNAVVAGGDGGTGGSGGSLRFKGASGGTSFSIHLTGLQVSISGVGASGIYGAGGAEVTGNTVSGSNGNAATGYGAGGSGGASQYQGGAQSGGDGSAGIVIITEYIQT